METPGKFRRMSEGYTAFEKVSVLTNHKPDATTFGA
jgi:hypothetical protein